MGMSVVSSLRRGLADTTDLPRVAAFHELYESGMRPRRGQLIMVSGRSGAQKSGFVLFWVAKMGLDTLYFSGDMSPYTAGSRMASIATGYTAKEVGECFQSDPWNAKLLAETVTRNVGHVDFVFSNPITVERIVDELNLHVLLYNRLPEVLVFDNLMDFAGAQDGYEDQMAVMQDVAMMTRDLGVTTIVVHHASDKTNDAQSRPYNPPSRRDIKNGLAEKPELSITVALGADVPGRDREFNVAVVKQRDGPNDPTATSFVTLFCDPSRTLFWDRFSEKG